MRWMIPHGSGPTGGGSALGAEAVEEHAEVAVGLGVVARPRANGVLDAAHQTPGVVGPDALPDGAGVPGSLEQTVEGGEQVDAEPRSPSAGAFRGT